MSAISAISSGISQFVQSLTSNNASPASSNASSGTTTATGGHHHHHGGGGGIQKLADAVTNALQSAASNSSSGTTTDPNQTITAALTKIFQNGSLGGTDDTDSSTDTTDATTNNATPGAPGTTSNTPSLPPGLAQTLQSFGVTAEQFQNDVTTALKNAQQSGTADLSTAFKSFPAGSFVDALG